MAVKAPTVADFTWHGDLKFAATVGRQSMTLDSAGHAGPSPVDVLVAALGGCMSVDLAHILHKGRHAMRGLSAHLVAERAQADPHRFVKVSLHFVVEGAVAADAVERAIALSRQKYCSVWHSMRQDIDFQVTFELRA